MKKEYTAPSMKMMEMNLSAMIMESLQKSTETVDGPNALSKEMNIWSDEEEEE